MKRKQIIKKLAILSASLCAVCIGCVVAPAVISRGKAAMEAAQENKALPQISIDSEGYDLSQAPRAVVGKEYKIFNASAKDNYGNDLKVAQKVWLYYYSSTKSRVTVQDGVFVPHQVGEYVVEYTAIDSEGKKATAIYIVECLDAKGLAVSLEQKVQTGIAGVEMSVAAPVLQNVSGESTIQIQAKHADGTDCQNIGKDLLFRPMYSGVYTIKYIVSDYVSTVSTEYEITVDANEIPVFLEQAIVPNYFIKNKSYSLEKPKAYHFALGMPVEIEPVLTILDENGNEQTLVGDEFTPTAEGDILIKYTISYGNNQQELAYNAKVVDVDYGLLNSYHKYFDADDYTVTMDKAGVEFFTMIDDASAAFINPILANKANVIFSGNGKYKNYESLDVYFTDSLDSSIAIKISFKDNVDGGMSYTINERSSYSFNTALTSGEKFELNYYNDETCFNLNSTLDIIVRKTLSGADFTGFPSGKMYVSFRLNGVDGAAGFFVHKLNNQNLNLIAIDSVPEIVFTRHEGGEMQVGDVVALNPFYVGDVLDNESIVSFYVLAPDGSYVTATNGTLLDGKNVDYRAQYSIIIEMSGLYNVCMEISDTLGNSELYAYGISVVDRTPPTILLIEGKTSCKVGESIKLWDAEAVDALGNKADMQVYVYTVDGYIINAKDGYFYAEKAGVYTVYYHAYDAKGNTAMQSYKITVL